MNRNVLIGCGGVFAVAVILAGLLILETPKFLEQGKSFVKRTVADEQRIALLETSWQPPSATVDGKWFPAAVSDARLERSEPSAGVPELNIDRAGHHGSYRSSRGTISIDLIPANELEKGALIKQAEDALSSRRRASTATDASGASVSVNRSSARLTTVRGNRTNVRVGLDDYTRFWWLKGTLFIFRARGAADSETFPEEYLRALLPASTPPGERIEKE